MTIGGPKDVSNRNVCDPQIVINGTPMGPFVFRNGTSFQSNKEPPSNTIVGTPFGLEVKTSGGRSTSDLLRIDDTPFYRITRVRKVSGVAREGRAFLDVGVTNRNKATV